VSKPFEYEEYRKRKVQEEIEKRREKRIAPLKRLKLAKLGPKVNAALAEKLMQKGVGGKKGTKADAAQVREVFHSCILQ
jgi:ribosome biogenesis protein ENP2